MITRGHAPPCAHAAKCESPRDSNPPKIGFTDYIQRERRYTSLKQTAPKEAEKLFAQAEKEAKKRYEFFAKFGSICEP
jgi:pyruvate-ferredoxin/flavodoxin oxidoreductase